MMGEIKGWRGDGGYYLLCFPRRCGWACGRHAVREGLFRILNEMWAAGRRSLASKGGRRKGILQDLKDMQYRNVDYIHCSLNC